MIKNFKKFLAVLLCSTFFATVAMADGYDLAVKNTKNFQTFSGSAATGDKAVIFDASDNVWKTIELSDFPLSGTTFVGTVTLDDGTGASPSFVMQDGTDEAATFSKVDAGFLTITTDATDGVNILTGNLKVGNGSPGVTLNGEDAYIEGTLETDGTVQFDGAVSATSTLGVTGTSTFTGKMVSAYSTSADSGAANSSLSIPFTYPINTTGTNTNHLINLALTAANATGGTNTVNGINFANYTGDAQVDVNAINIGTSDALGTAVALKIGTGWDTGISVGSPVTGSGLSTVSNMVGFTRAIQTQQTTLTAAMCGSVVTNSGAVVSTLPEASTVLGCTFTFVTGNASNFDVNPADGTDTISLLTNAAGDAVRNATVGNSLCLIAVSNDLWHQCASPVGTWSDVN